MGKKDPRVDAYIANSAEFAQPILRAIRKVVHAGCPEAEETLKWRFPHFMYKGILCSMASFKAHCAFGFWKGKLLEEKLRGAVKGREPAMGDFGRLTSVADLPDEKTLIRYVKEAAALNDEGIPRPVKRPPKGERTLVVPPYFLGALKKSKKALATFEGFNYSNKKEYVEWVTEAKGEETRKRRLETAVAWMAEGKARSWKYLRK
jgi:uncharacterized protein YdeI (YjbR/CyaY-like superfamily)